METSNTRFNADIAFVMEIAYVSAPLKRLRFFLCNFHAKPYTGTQCRLSRESKIPHLNYKITTYNDLYDYTAESPISTDSLVDGNGNSKYTCCL